MHSHSWRSCKCYSYNYYGFVTRLTSHLPCHLKKVVMLRYVCKYLHVCLKIDEYSTVNKLNQGVLLAINPFTPKISLVILLTVWHITLMMLVQRFCSLINLWSPYLYFSLFSSLVYLTLYWYFKEKFCFGHSWEIRD